MTGPRKPEDYLRQGRRDRLLRELEHDPYHLKFKFKEPTACPECGAVFHEGRWTWMEEPPGDAHSHLCPACQRIRDKVPAAFLTIKGEFFGAHRDEIMHLIRNYEERERQEHPLKRVMGMDEIEDGLEVTFTDAHLARGIGEALHDAYQGELDYQYTKEDIMLRVRWER
ncbi:MAG TPA: ATPase [Chromatiales bacterium]|nr:ATPase [Chromatiales bacterium]